LADEEQKLRVGWKKTDRGFLTVKAEASIFTSWYAKGGSHDYYKEGRSVYVIEDRDGKCFRDVPFSEEWTTICEGVELRRRFPDPKDKNSTTWDLRVRRDVAPIYVHILSLEESWCDDASFGDNSSRSSVFVYAIRLDVGAPCDSDTGG
jgi:hypothetical protein